MDLAPYFSLKWGPCFQQAGSLVCRALVPGPAALPLAATHLRPGCR